MNPLIVEQLKELADQMGWVLVLVKDEDGKVVMITIGDEPWIDEFYSDAY